MKNSIKSLRHINSISFCLECVVCGRCGAPLVSLEPHTCSPVYALASNPTTASLSRPFTYRAGSEPSSFHLTDSAVQPEAHVVRQISLSLYRFCFSLSHKSISLSYLLFYSSLYFIYLFFPFSSPSSPSLSLFLSLSLSLSLSLTLSLPLSLAHLESENVCIHQIYKCIIIYSFYL